MPEFDRLLDRRVAVPHQHLDIAGDRDGPAGVLDQLPLGVVQGTAMDIGGVGFERVLRVELFQQAAAAELADAGMNADAGADVAGSLERVEDQLGRAGRGRHVQRQKLIVAGEILLAQTCNVARELVSLHFPESAVLVLRVAIGEHGSDTGIRQRLDDRVRVLRGVVDVRPVQHRGDAGVDGAERAEQVGGIDIIGRHLRAERPLHDVAVVFERAVRQHVAQITLPHVAVGIDEARHHDRLGGIDHVCVGCSDVRLHRGNPAALDQDIGLLEVADRAIEAEHATALDQDRPARRGGRGRRLGLSDSGRARSHRRDGKRARGRGAEELAARHSRSRAACAAMARLTGVVAQIWHGILPLHVVWPDASPLQGLHPGTLLVSRPSKRLRERRAGTHRPHQVPNSATRRAGIKR